MKKPITCSSILWKTNNDMKLRNKIVLITTSICLILGCTRKSESTVEEKPSITGAAFLQPIDKKLSLALAPTTYLVIDFLDSVYCDVEYHGYRNMKISRKYTIDSNNVLKVYNPVTTRTKTFKIVEEGTNSFLVNTKGIKLYKILSSDTLNAYINTSELKKGEFLYPTLTPSERQFGAEDRFVKDENGNLQMMTHPLKSKVRKIDIFNLF